jgi:hypothetical protein
MRSLTAVMSAVLLFSSSIWSAGPILVGNLHSSGIVMTNFVPMPDGGTVRTGDRIATTKGSLAFLISSSLGRLEVRSDSVARLGADHLQLERGSVASDRLPIQAAGYTIRPQTARPAWFAVAKRDGRLVVAAHRGNVLIASAAAPPVVVTEGSVAEQEPQPRQQPEQQQPAQTQDQQQPPAQPQDQPQEPASDQQQKSGKKKKGAAAAATGGWVIGSLSHAASVALVVGAGAAVAGTAAGVATTRGGETSNPSPSQ